MNCANCDAEIDTCRAWGRLRQWDVPTKGAPPQACTHPNLKLPGTAVPRP